MASTESIRRVVSKLTGLKFKVTEPKPDSPASAEKINWFMASPYHQRAKGRFHANVLWESVNGDVHIESTPIGNTLLWVEMDYDDDRSEVSEIDFTNFSDKETRKKFAERFTLVHERLDSYERILNQQSSKWRTELWPRYYGEKGFATLYIHVRIKGAGLDLQSKLEKIQIAIEALEDSLDEIEEFEAQRLKEIK